MANWTDTLNELMFPDDENMDEALASSTQAQNHDIGMINTKSGAGILARETGVLEGFSYYNLGFRFDPKTMTASFFAPTIQMFCQDYIIMDGSTSQAYDPINQDYQDILKLIGVQIDDKV